MSLFLNNPLCIAVPCVSFDCYFNMFSVSGAPSLPIEFITLLFFLPEPKPESAFELHFRFFNRVFASRFCMQCYCTNPSDLQDCACPITHLRVLQAT